MIIGTGTQYGTLENFLSEIRGVWYSQTGGPLESSHKVATLKQPNGIRINEHNDQIVQDQYSQDEQTARYVQKGWPKPTEVAARPWDVLKPNSAPTSTSVWGTRRFVVKRYEVAMAPEDLTPEASFAKAVETALNAGSVARQVAAFRTLLANWGEVIPLVFEVGIYLAATGSLRPGRNLSVKTPDSSLNTDPVTVVDSVLGVQNDFERKLASEIRGSTPDILATKGMQAWLDGISSSNLAVIKVLKAIPITEILSVKSQNRIRDLFSNPSLYSPSESVGPPVKLGFDGAANGLRDIRSIKVWFTTSIQGLSVTYDGNITAGPFGKFDGTVFDTVTLAPGEYITAVFAWANTTQITALRFVKNTGQLSAHFGGTYENSSDPPTLLSGNGSALVGLSGTFNPSWIVQLQAVWRNDMEIPTSLPTQTDFAGAVGGTIFNDLDTIGDTFTTRLTKIQLRDSANYIAQFQAMYTWDGPTSPISAITPPRGVDAAAKIATFELEPNEYIVQVEGRYDGALRQIMFTTNKPRSSPVYGLSDPNAGTGFKFTAPDSMRLHYFVGKSQSYVHSLLFVWASFPYSNRALTNAVDTLTSE